MIRAGAGAMFTAGAAFFASVAAGSSVTVAGVAAGAAFCAVMLSRGGAEGLYDATAASTASKGTNVVAAPESRPLPPPPPPAPLIGAPPQNPGG